MSNFQLFMIVFGACYCVACITDAWRETRRYRVLEARCFEPVAELDATELDT